jgi:hypothetical protein
MEEAAHVHVEGGGANEDLRIARPAEALVALRAVGGVSECSTTPVTSSL